MLDGDILKELYTNDLKDGIKQLSFIVDIYVSQVMCYQRVPYTKNVNLMKSKNAEAIYGFGYIYGK